MKFINKDAHLFIPDQCEAVEAISRTTHMAIAAHQDDIEIMAYDGILKCFQDNNQFFFGVVVTDGASSARSGIYQHYSNEQMKDVRHLEQVKASVIGEYGALAQLGYSSQRTKDKEETILIDELYQLLILARPKVLYTHNLADKHDTHIGVSTKVIKALRLMPMEQRPTKVYGCEVWRNLDWVNDNEKVVFQVDQHPNLAASLVEVFDSQIAGGKRYDFATIGRRLANATFYTSHQTDQSTSSIYAMDLTPLIEDDSLDITTYVTDYIKRFLEDVAKKINSMY
jgi:LmbE family N-acetylglucosaminyl deacetylase